MENMSFRYANNSGSHDAHCLGIGVTVEGHRRYGGRALALRWKGVGVAVERQWRYDGRATRLRWRGNENVTNVTSFLSR